MEPTSPVSLTDSLITLDPGVATIWLEPLISPGIYVCVLCIAGASPKVFASESTGSVSDLLSCNSFGASFFSSVLVGALSGEAFEGVGAGLATVFDLAGAVFLVVAFGLMIRPYLSFLGTAAANFFSLFSRIF